MFFVVANISPYVRQDGRIQMSSITGRHILICICVLDMDATSDITMETDTATGAAAWHSWNSNSSRCSSEPFEDSLSS